MLRNQHERLSFRHRTQQQIVVEIEAERALVAANRELIERFEKKIQATLAPVWGEDTGDTPK